MSSSNSSAPSPQPANESIEVFISYSHKDEDLKDELYIHLANLTRQGKIKPWQDRAIEAGTEWDAEIKARLESAGVILLLITPRFIASQYCFDKEMQRAMERHAEGTARVIPIIMKPCDWQDTPFSKLQVLPKDAKPVTAWSDQDEALLNVVQGIRRAVDSLAKLAPAPVVPKIESASAASSKTGFYERQMAQLQEELAAVESDLATAPREIDRLRLEKEAERLLNKMEALKPKLNSP